MLLDDERDKNQSAPSLSLSLSLSLCNVGSVEKIMFAAVPHARMHAQKNAQEMQAGQLITKQIPFVLSA
jgi:hypothetical protein